MLGGLLGNGLFGGSERGFVAPSAGGGDSTNTTLGPPIGDSFLADRGSVTGINGQGKPIDGSGTEVVPSPGGSSLFLPGSIWGGTFGQGEGIYSTQTQGVGPGPSLASNRTAILCPDDEEVEQTLFFGASIMDFSVTLGYGEQSSSLTVRLVEDECEGTPRTYYQGHDRLTLGNQSTLEEVSTTKPDKFLPPKVGSAVYFRMANYEFCGIFQSFTKSRGTGGKPVYTVTLLDPRELLAGVNLIIADEYTDAALTPNIINVFAIMEQYGIPCPSTEGGAFGGAGSIEEGMPWNNIYKGLMISQSGLSAFSGITPKRPRMGNCEYHLDLTNLPVPPDDYRVSGTNVSVLDAVSQLCEDAGFEFFIDLIPAVVEHELGYFYTVLILKVRCVDRTTQPNLDAIENFIDDPDNLVMESSNGREFRNDVTSAMVIGGKKTDMYECECPGFTAGCSITGIQPYWGVDDNENLITGCRQPNNGEYFITVSTTNLNSTLEKNLPFTTYTLTESEMKAALMGEKAWTGWITANQHPISTLFFGNKPLQVWAFDSLRKVLQKVKNNNGNLGGEAPNIKPQHFVQVNNALRNYVSKSFASNPGEQAMEDLKRVFSWVQGFARKYGKEWIVPLEGICNIVDRTSGTPRVAAHPTDKGWTDDTTILNLGSPLAKTIFGGDDTDGRLTAFVRYNLYSGGSFGGAFSGSSVSAGRRLDFSKLTKGEYYSNNQAIWIKASNTSEIAYLQNQRKLGPHAILKVSAPLTVKPSEQGVNEAYAALSRVIEIVQGGNQAAARRATEQLRKGIGSNWANIGMSDEAMIPVAATIPMQYEGATYGPWETSGAADGKTRVQVDDSLVPWNYAGHVLLNQAGQSLADQQVTNMQQGEMGSIKVPGLPNKIKIGWELNQIKSDFALVENRTVSSISIAGGGQLTGISEYYYINEPTMNNSYGPNLTGIQITIGPAGVTSTYNFRTYTPKFARFAKLNAERLKKMARARIASAKEQRKLNLKALQLQGKGFRGAPGMGGFTGGGGGGLGQGGGVGDVPAGGQHQQGQRVGKEQTAAAGGSVAMAAKATEMKTADGNTGISVDMAFLPGGELQTIIDEDYGQKAIAGIESLLYPVSLGGDANLPPLAFSSLGAGAGSVVSKPNGPYNAAASKTDQLHDGSYYIDGEHAQPWQNPGGFSFSKLQEDNLGKSRNDIDEGHGNDLVARGGQPPDSSLFSEVAEHHGQSEAYSNDYRFLALKGPVMIHGWGYDLQGKPIPNAADTAGGAAAGSFTTTALEDKFLPGFLRNSHTWPTAPLDLRFDRERGVWTTPQPPRFAQVILEKCGGKPESLQPGEETVSPTDCTGGKLKAKEVDGTSPAAWDEDGSDANDDKYLIVKNDGEQSIPVGKKFKVYWDNYIGKWLPFGMAGGGEDIVIAKMYVNMEPDQNGQAEIVCPTSREGEMIDVINTLKQPIAKDKHIIAWNLDDECEDPCAEECAGSSSSSSPGEESSDESESSSSSETEPKPCYRVLQAEFCPLNVVTSVYVEEKYDVLGDPLTSGGSTQDGEHGCGGSVTPDIKICNKKIAVKVWVDEYAQTCNSPVVTSLCGGGDDEEDDEDEDYDDTDTEETKFPPGGGNGGDPDPERPDEPEDDPDGIWCDGPTGNGCCILPNGNVVPIDDILPTGPNGNPPSVSTARCTAATDVEVVGEGMGLGGTVGNCAQPVACAYQYKEGATAGNPGDIVTFPSYCANDGVDGEIWIDGINDDCGRGPNFNCCCCDLSDSDKVEVLGDELQNDPPTNVGCCSIVPINSSFTRLDCEIRLGGKVVDCPQDKYPECEGREGCADSDEAPSNRCCKSLDPFTGIETCHEIGPGEFFETEEQCEESVLNEVINCDLCPPPADPTDSDCAEASQETDYYGGHKSQNYPGPKEGAAVGGPSSNDEDIDGYLDSFTGASVCDIDDERPDFRGSAVNLWTGVCDAELSPTVAWSHPCLTCKKSDGTWQSLSDTFDAYTCVNTYDGTIYWKDSEERDDLDTRDQGSKCCSWVCEYDGFDGKVVTPLTEINAKYCREELSGKIMNMNLDDIVDGSRAGSAAQTEDDNESDDEASNLGDGGRSQVDDNEIAPRGISEDPTDEGSNAGSARDGKGRPVDAPSSEAGYSSESTGTENPCDLSSALSTSEDDVSLTVCTVVPAGAITSSASCSPSYPGFGTASFTIKSCADYKFNIEFDHVMYPLLWIDVCERTIYLQSAYSNPVCSTERGADQKEMSPYTTANSMGLEMPVFNKPSHEELTGYFYGYSSPPPPSKIQTGTFNHDKENEASDPEPTISFEEGTESNGIWSWESCENCDGSTGSGGGGGTSSPGETWDEDFEGGNISSGGGNTTSLRGFNVPNSSGGGGGGNRTPAPVDRYQGTVHLPNSVTNGEPDDNPNIGDGNAPRGAGD